MLTTEQIVDAYMEGNVPTLTEEETKAVLGELLLAITSVFVLSDGDINKGIEAKRAAKEILNANRG